MRSFILKYDENITEAWKYGMPMFLYKKKMFCYLWTDKKTGEPYLGIADGKHIDHPRLEEGGRSRMKILRLCSTDDLPVEIIREIFQMVILNP